MTLIMNSGKRRSLLICIIATTFFMIGCSRTRIIDDVKILQSVGYDIEDNRIIGTAAYPVYVESIQESHPKKLFTASSTTTTGIFTTFTRQTANVIDISQLSSVVVSQEFAKEGIQDLLINLTSDPNIGTNSRVIISKISAKGLLEESMKYPPYYLSTVLEQNMKFGNVPYSNLHTATFQYYSEGQDIYIPMMDINNDGIIVGNGVGIFKDDKVKLFLNNEKTLLLKFLVEDLGINSTYEISTPDKKNILIKISSVKRETSVNVANGTPEIKYNINFKAFLKEQIPNLSRSDINNRVTKEIETQLDNELTSLLEEFQNEKVDPVGIGNFFKAAQRTWDKNEFYERDYPKIKFVIETDVNLVDTGVRK